MVVLPVLSQVPFCLVTMIVVAYLLGLASVQAVVIAVYSAFGVFFLGMLPGFPFRVVRFTLIISAPTAFVKVFSRTCAVVWRASW